MVGDVSPRTRRCANDYMPPLYSTWRGKAAGQGLYSSDGADLTTAIPTVPMVPRWVHVPVPYKTILEHGKKKTNLLIQLLAGPSSAYTTVY